MNPPDVDEGQRCLNMLTLCGELGGKRTGEMPSSYLRRLIDAVIDLERALNRGITGSRA
jgi:hypothetical protein